MATKVTRGDPEPVSDVDEPTVLDGDETQPESTPEETASKEESREERLDRLKAALTDRGELETPEDETEDGEGDEEPNPSDDAPDEEVANDPPPPVAAKPTTEVQPTSEGEKGIDFVEGASIPKDVWKALPKEAHVAFRALRDEVIRSRHERSIAESERDADKPFAEYGRQIDEFAAQHQLTDAGLQEGLSALALINAGKPEAIPWLLSYAERLGWKPVPAATEAPAGPAALRKLLEAGAITPEEYAEVTRELPRPTSAPVPAPQPTQQVLQQAGVPAMRRQAPPAGESSYEARVKDAQTKITAREAELRAQHGVDWDSTLRAKVDAEMNRFRGAPPEQWLRILDQSYRVVLSELKASKPLTRTTRTEAGGHQAPRSRAPEIDKLRGRERVRSLARRGNL